MHWKSVSRLSTRPRSSRPSGGSLRRRLVVALAVCAIAGPSAYACSVAARLHFEKAPPEERMQRARELAAPWLVGNLEMDMKTIDYALKAAVDCTGGTADGFACSNVDLLAHLPLASIGGGSGNDIWGWTSLGGREFALVGRSNGTAFVEITNPEAPVYLGNLPSHNDTSTWRDIKVYQNHAFIVADFVTNHGMQVFDLTQLLNVASPPMTFTETAHYDAFERAHNIVINEDTGFAYAVGSEVCSGGLHMIDITTPTQPTTAGCFADDAYTHDAQCVVYAGPDTEHQGKEICFASNEDTLTIVDVTDKANPAEISRNGYTGWGYTHQGWLSEDHTLFYLDDEFDEATFNHNTKTWVWDLTDLDTPVIEQVYESNFPSTDHNQYVVGNRIFQANYSIGLRILERDPATTTISEVAFFDTHPESNSSTGGAWSVYPFFPSGAIVVGDINRGLFVLRPDIPDLFQDDFEGGSADEWDDATPPLPVAPPSSQEVSGSTTAASLSTAPGSTAAASAAAER